jgi:sugar transferase (PEP-CTERM/EpsH1 system associated)
MNILFLCHRIPYPPNKGDKIRSFNEVRYLSKNHNLSLAFLIDNKSDVKFIDELKKYCRTIDYDVINPSWQKIKSLFYLLSKRPLTVPYFYSTKLQKAIDRRLLEIRFDIIFAFSSPMAEYVFKSKVIQLNKRKSNINYHIKLIMDFVDVDSDKWRMYSGYSIFPKSLIYKNEWRRLMRYEKKIGEVFDLSLFVSDTEVGLFKSFAPHVNAVSIPNGVDFSYFSMDQKINRQTVKLTKSLTSQQTNILFTGAMDYFPNEDGVLYFYHKIWPIIKKKLPQSKFYIVGGNPSKKLKSISKKDKDIVITGYVDNVRQYMHEADVFVAPIRIARGIQNKVLEAIASGLPVVSTPQAVQGINCNGGDFLFVEDSAEKFAERTIELARKYLTNEAIERGKTFLKQRHNWEKNMTLLENLIVNNSL